MDRIFEYKNGAIKMSYLSEHSFDQTKTMLSHSIKKEYGYIIPNSYRLGIELKENHGGRICYGFISASIVPCSQRKIGVAFEYEKKLDDSILRDSVYNSNTVGIGLPYEFRQDLEKHVISSLEKIETFPWCNIIFDQFMHCKVGSSKKIYEIIVNMMLKIINNNPQQNIINWNINDFTKVCIIDSNLTI